MSLKLALEQLLGTSCYHMLEVFGRPDHVEMWHGAVQVREADWQALFDGFGACVDWPAAAYWRQIAEANPDAIILLSVRDADDWWRSCDRTIFQVMREDMPEGLEPWLSMVREMFERTFTPSFLDADKAKAAFEQHNADVRANARCSPSSRASIGKSSAGQSVSCVARMSSNSQSASMIARW